MLNPIVSGVQLKAEQLLHFLAQDEDFGLGTLGKWAK
jgi:hypothetical protein